MLKHLQEIPEFGKRIDFGRTASDYGRFRAGYPDELYRRLEIFGAGVRGQRMLDVACGTGFLGRGFVRQGCAVTGADISFELMRQAAQLDAEAGVEMRYLRAKAEALPFSDRVFDVVTVGQAWHWFGRSRAAAEARRVLRAGGLLVIAHFDWIPIPGNVVEATERLIEKHNPQWKLGGGLGIHPQWPRDAAIAGFGEIETFSFDVAVRYSHEAWRGRIRASAGVAAALSAERVANFDCELAALLRERFPQEPMGVPHRTFATVARSPRNF
ncbi:MAG: class I SAM-dependent methyltransferase [Candidatus Acidiferrales bacterium]